MWAFCFFYSLSQYVRNVLSVLPIGPHYRRRMVHWKGRLFHLSGIFEISTYLLGAGEIILWLLMVLLYASRFTTQERWVLCPPDSIARDSSVRSRRLITIALFMLVPAVVFRRSYSVYQDIDADVNYMQFRDGGSSCSPSPAHSRPVAWHTFH